MTGAEAYYLKPFVIFGWFELPDRTHSEGSRGVLFVPHCHRKRFEGGNYMSYLVCNSDLLLPSARHATYISLSLPL